MQLERIVPEDWLGGIEFRITFDHFDLATTDQPLPTLEHKARISDHLKGILQTALDIEEKTVRLGMALQELNPRTPRP